MDKSIPNLQDLIYFVITGRSSSITAASIESGIPVATLSRRISALEKRVNIQLFTRTSRGIVLTEIGRHYLKYADAIIKNATDLEREMKDSHNSLSGVLRVSLPVDFGISFISPLMNRFSTSYPNIRFIFDTTPVKVNITERQIDICIRIGDISDMSLIARPVGFLCRKLYASPAYLRQYKTPEHPDDLIHHQCILPSYMKEPEKWVLFRGNDITRINVSGIYSANNISMMLKLSENNGGIAVLTPEIIHRELSSRAIVPILEEWSFKPLPVYIITGTRNISKSARLFLDYINSQLSVILNSH